MLSLKTVVFIDTVICTRFKVSSKDNLLSEDNMNEHLTVDQYLMQTDLMSTIAVFHKRPLLGWFYEGCPQIQRHWSQGDTVRIYGHETCCT